MAWQFDAQRGVWLDYQLSSRLGEQATRLLGDPMLALHVTSPHRTEYGRIFPTGVVSMAPKLIVDFMVELFAVEREWVELPHLRCADDGWWGTSCGATFKPGNDYGRHPFELSEHMKQHGCTLANNGVLQRRIGRETAVYAISANPPHAKLLRWALRENEPIAAAPLCLQPGAHAADCECGLL